VQSRKVWKAKQLLPPQILRSGFLSVKEKNRCDSVMTFHAVSVSPEQPKRKRTVSLKVLIRISYWQTNPNTTVIMSLFWNGLSEKKGPKGVNGAVPFQKGGLICMLKKYRISGRPALTPSISPIRYKIGVTWSLQYFAISYSIMFGGCQDWKQVG